MAGLLVPLYDVAWFVHVPQLRPRRGKGMKNQENHRAGYIGEITVELAKMARTDGLDLLAYLLDMVTLESELTSKKSHNAQRR